MGRLPPIPVSPSREVAGEWSDPTPEPQRPVQKAFYIPPFDTSSFVDPPEPEAKLEPENGDKPTYPAPPAKRRRWRP